MPDDQRMTPVGTFIRKSSIDELSKQIDQDMANMLEIQERESRRQEKIINSMVEREKKDLWKW